MADNFEIILEFPAEFTMVALPQVDREHVRRSIDRLRRGPEPEGGPASYRIEGPNGEGLYVLPVEGTPRLRLAYRVTAPGVIRVQDIVNHDLVRSHFMPAGR